MGDNYLKKQCEYLRKRMARSSAEFNTRTLCERPEVMTTVFSGELDEDFSINSGECLRAQKETPDGPVLLIKDYIKVGTITGEGGQALSEILNKPESGGVVTLVISDRSEISGCARLRIKE